MALSRCGSQSCQNLNERSPKRRLIAGKLEFVAILLQREHDALIDHIDALANRLFADTIQLNDATAGSGTDFEAVIKVFTSTKANMGGSLDKLSKTLICGQQPLFCDANVQMLDRE